LIARSAATADRILHGIPILRDVGSARPFKYATLPVIAAGACGSILG
jgi:hypothetical protein